MTKFINERLNVLHTVFHFIIETQLKKTPSISKVTLSEKVPVRTLFLTFLLFPLYRDVFVMIVDAHQGPELQCLLRVKEDIS